MIEQTAIQDNKEVNKVILMRIKNEKLLKTFKARTASKRLYVIAEAVGSLAPQRFLIGRAARK